MLRKQLGLVVCLCLGLGSVHAHAQSVTAVIDRDVRVFSVVAALNAAGFDVELAARYHPVRQQMRDALGTLDLDLVRRLREFYDQHRAGDLDETQLAKYLSLALNLTDPPTLEFAFDEDFIPPDARELEEFLPLLREFYDAAQITQLWSTLAPSYDEALDQMGPPMRDTILQSDAYVRRPFGQAGPRQLVIFVELAAPINSVNVRNYPENLYIVLGDSTVPRVEDVRHAYLHLLLDPIVARERVELSREERLTSLIGGVDGVRPDYAEDFEIQVAESLIRAIELRMDDPVTDLDAVIDTAYRSGLLLVPFFHERLLEYEASEVGIRDFFPDMLDSVDVDVEIARFEEQFYSIVFVVEDIGPAEVPPAPPVVDPIPVILREAQQAFNAGEDDTARSAFERVLAENDPSNGPALYGLALIASREGDPLLASEYFSRTLDSQSAEPSMRVWSHIYLGRIYDLQCEREAAVGQYRSALEVGDDTQGAQGAAALGADQAFGPGCDF